MKAVIFPGQGAQFKGMGRELFQAYPAQVAQASTLLGYSIEELCLQDPDNRLHLTQYTQPALYVVGALGYYQLRDAGGPGFRPDFLAGHSLGEFNALLAADVFSFDTGLKLVQKRGALMGKASGGAMAAIVGTPVDKVKQLLAEHRLDGIDLANFNTPTQVVIAGTKSAIGEAAQLFGANGIRCVLLNVSAAFHSRHMQEAQQEFSAYLAQFPLKDPTVPVIANATARPYRRGEVVATLGRQIANPVCWVDSVRYLMGKGVTFTEIGATKVLGKMINEIQTTEQPIVDDAVVDAAPPAAVIASPKVVQAAAPAPAAAAAPVPAATPLRPAIPAPPAPAFTAHSLGSQVFRQRFGLKYAYLSGAMYRGVASAELVVRMGRAGFMGFFGAGGLSLPEIEQAIRTIQEKLTAGEPYGMNLLANYVDPAQERRTVELYLRHKVRVIEAAAFMQMTPSIVLYRLKGLRQDAGGKTVCDNRVLAKVSRPEVALAFMSPSPPHIVQQLLNEGSITPLQAELARQVPVAHDVCVEADSGGHTDGGISTVMLPAMLRLRDELSRNHGYAEPICMGLAGGIGAPEAAAAAFVMGADFILTGSINQCTVDAGMSDDAKNLLQEINIQDTEYAPAGDMFEIGAKVQVLKKGVFFPTRANKLFSLYSQYNGLDEIPEKIRHQLQTSYFKKTFVEIWDDTKVYLHKQGMAQEIARADANPKHKMALVFRWYFGYSSRLALEGKGEDKVNYQIHTGPALGAFNQWVKGSALESWKNRHADEIGKKMMLDTAQHLTLAFQALSGTMRAMAGAQ
jgi:trans-AT polyketide synthase/acyltransferase/oxidoreductase domain-containing protein